ncbi:ectonucleoside triphosphate diphosphohydrolase 3 [Paramormyrops kingsleyae]|uniref:Ectonucleoside triphosphate diphosphohydrolase 3 n=1 Tax=Paramormyrops kingsleyae TaxID=1676925 RepID=A0A3B3SPP6_9TELE|nr:ectonucleoside triphosphate diphosphohydrolase 3 [Paramormyrops kingsleyae]
MTSRLAVSLAVFFLLASIAVIITVAVIQVHKTNFLSPGLKYGIVLDAGSSRTTVYLYQWPAEKENNTGVVTQTLKCRVEGPGISSFGQDPDQDRCTWHSMKECMAQTLETIPLSQHNSTPLFLGATAGMRLLRSKNESASDKILLDIRRYLQSLPFSFGNASIISGEEEGLYGWITANYLMGNFVEKNLWNAWVRPHGAKTIGSLDLGGASTQIAFSTTPAEGQAPPGYTKVWLYGYEYSVYTHSFTCYGKDEAERKVLASLVRTSSSSQVKNPCYHTGYSTTMSAGYIFETPCNQKTSNYNPKQQLTLVGTGDLGLCRSTVRAAFDLGSCQGRSNCSFNGVYQPPVSGDFVAYAGFSYITEMFGLNQSFSLDAFDSKIRSHCSLPWKTLTEGSSKKEKYLRSYCYSANLAYVLLVEGYKFSPETWNNIRFQNEINQNSVAWPLGYMLALSNMIPAEAKLVQLPMASSVFAGLLFMFSTLAILCFMFLAIALVRACY